MKRKLLLAALCVVSALGMRAQTDVTSTYLTNPSFELSAAGTTTSAQALSSGGSYYGWTLPALGSSFVNISIGDESTCNGQAFGVPTATEGSYYYYERRGWNSSTSADATLSTNLTSLPVGHYTLTMDYKGIDSWDDQHKSSGSYLKLETVEAGTTLASQQTVAFEAVKGNSAGSGKFTGSSNWKSVTLEFDVTIAGDVQLNIVHHFVGGVRTDAAIDNLKLTYTDPEAAAKAAKLEAAKYTLLGYIKKGTAVNGVLNSSSLTTGIAQAQAVYDAATDYNTHYNTVLATIAQAKSAVETATSSYTSVPLVNGDFNTTPNNTLDGENTVFGGTLSTATSNPDNTKDFSANTGDHAYLYDVTGWTQFSKFNSTAAQGTTSEYGTAMPANGWSTNSTTPPAVDILGASEGAALHLSAGWDDQARYQQTIASLPSGRYIMYYEVINQHSNTGIASNYIGVNGAAGDFYGTTNAFVYSDLKSIEQGVWKAQAFEFDVAKTADINFSVGVTTSTSGSGNGAKLWVDNVLVYRIGDIIVTDAEAEAILAEVAALDEAVYNATDKSNLASAKSAFESNKNIDNYNTLNAALIAAKASVDVYKTLDAAIKKVEGWTATTAAEGIRTKYTNGDYTNETAAEIYAAYQAAEIAALTADASATDWTSVILNASFETGDMTGWGAESRNDTGVKNQSDGTYSITSGFPADGSKLFNSWGGSSENNVYQTIKNLPAGTYTLTAVLAGFNGEDLVLAANNETAIVTVAGDKTVGYTANVVFTLSDPGDVIIKASNTKGQSASDASFLKADKFQLYKGDVMTNDYTALNAAITAAESKTLGFEEDEFAPYKNVDALTALATAKSIDQTSSTAQPVIDEIVNMLTTWTANTEEVNAFSNGGNFGSSYAGLGWKASGWIAEEGNYIAVPGGVTVSYGESDGFTIPLKANTTYKLTFRHASWDGNNKDNGGTVSLLLDDKGLAATDYTGNDSGKGNDAGYKKETFFFTTGDAGNYVFKLVGKNGRTTVKDFQLFKAPEASANMTVKANKWGTFIAPFNVTIPAGIKAYTVSGVDDNGYMKKTAVETTIPANTPVVLENTTSESISENFADQSTATADSYTVGALTGVYTAATIPASTATTINYVLQTQNDVQAFYIVNDPTAAFTATPNRCYLTVEASTEAAPRAIFIEDGDATGIEGVDGQIAKGKVKGIYSANGTELNQLQKGLNIVKMADGKVQKVYVK